MLNVGEVLNQVGSFDSSGNYVPNNAPDAPNRYITINGQQVPIRLIGESGAQGSWAVGLNPETGQWEPLMVRDANYGKQVWSHEAGGFVPYEGSQINNIGTFDWGAPETWGLYEWPFGTPQLAEGVQAFKNNALPEGFSLGQQSDDVSGSGYSGPPTDVYLRQKTRKVGGWDGDNFSWTPEREETYWELVANPWDGWGQAYGAVMGDRSNMRSTFGDIASSVGPIIAAALAGGAFNGLLGGLGGAGGATAGEAAGALGGALSEGAAWGAGLAGSADLAALEAAVGLAPGTLGGALGAGAGALSEGAAWGAGISPTDLAAMEEAIGLAPGTLSSGGGMWEDIVNWGKEVFGDDVVDTIGDIWDYGSDAVGDVWDFLTGFSGGPSGGGTGGQGGNVLDTLLKLGIPAAAIAGMFENNESPLVGPMTDAANAAFASAQQFAGLEGPGITPSQQAAIDLANSSAGKWQDLLEEGADWQRQAAGGIPDVDLSLYMNPYIESVLSNTLRDIDEAAAKRREELKAITAMSGNDFRTPVEGGNRFNVEDSLLDREWLRAIGDTSAKVRASAFDTATSLASRDLDRKAQVGGAFGNFAQAGSNLDTADFSRLYDAGRLERQPYEDKRANLGDATKLYTGVIHGTSPALSATTPDSLLTKGVGALGAIKSAKDLGIL